MSEPSRLPGPAAERPLVSVLIPCHNYGRFLTEAIDSALAQTWPPHEILVVDDGSTDDSADVARSYGSRIRVVSRRQSGLERTVNWAVPELTGEYVVILSADDVLEPRYIEELAAALRRSPDAAYAYCRPLKFGAESGPMRCLPFSAYFLVKRTNFVNASALMRRDDFLAVGGYSENLGPDAIEDWDFFLKLLAAGRRGTYVRAPLLRWRRHETGSRNVERGERAARATEVARARHDALVAAMRDARGRLYYALDYALAAADQAVGFSRWPRAVQAVERSSWRRFRRHHAPKLHG